MCPAAVTSFYKPAPQTCAKQMNADKEEEEEEPKHKRRTTGHTTGNQ
jgi:hypothetical protein